MGAVDKLAYYFNDYVVDFTSNDNADLWSYDDNVDNIIYFAELKFNINEGIRINPYAYYQDQYVGWYGLDTAVRLKKTATYEYRTSLCLLHGCFGKLRN